MPRAFYFLHTSGNKSKLQKLFWGQFRGLKNTQKWNIWCVFEEPKTQLKGLVLTAPSSLLVLYLKWSVSMYVLQPLHLARVSLVSSCNSVSTIIINLIPGNHWWTAVQIRCSRTIKPNQNFICPFCSDMPTSPSRWCRVFSACSAIMTLINYLGLINDL